MAVTSSSDIPMGWPSMAVTTSPTSRAVAAGVPSLMKAITAPVPVAPTW